MQLETNTSISATKSVKRYEEIDILKAMAIVFMVAGHAGAPFGRFIYLFHMAVFFMASGFFFKKDYSTDIKSVLLFVKKKVKSLWIPFFVWLTVFYILNNTFVYLNVYTDNPIISQYVKGSYIGTHNLMTKSDILKSIIKAAFFGGGTQIAGAFWFLRVLFFISVAYCMVEFLTQFVFKSSIPVIHTILSILLLAVGFWFGCNGKTIHGIELVCSYYALFYLGNIFKGCANKFNNWRTQSIIIVFIVSVLTLLLLGNYGNINLANNEYENPFFLIATSILGWWLLYSFAVIFCRYERIVRNVKQVLLFVGRRTLPILILHFLSFKIVNLIICIVYDLPLCCVAAFPNLYGNKGSWWVLFTVVGIVIPIMSYEVYYKVFHVVFKRKRRFLNDENNNPSIRCVRDNKSIYNGAQQNLLH